MARSRHHSRLAARRTGATRLTATGAARMRIASAGVVSALAVSAAVVPATLLSVASAPAAAASVRTPTSGPAEVLAVRTGHHATYDRIVIDLSHPAGAYSVAYRSRLVDQDSGAPVDLQGRAQLEIVLDGVRAHDDSFAVTTSTPWHQRPLLAQVRETAILTDFEDTVTLGVGVDHRTSYRVFTLRSPDRLVIDVRH